MIHFSCHIIVDQMNTGGKDVIFLLIEVLVTH